MNKTVRTIFTVVMWWAAAFAPPPFCFAEPLEQTEIVDLFSQGKDFFRQANQIAARDPEGAKKLYLKAAMRFERIVREGKIRNGKMFYNIGNVYNAGGMYGKAKKFYEEALSIVPRYVEALNNLGLVLEKTGDVKGAQEQFEKAIRINPGFIMAYNNLGTLFARNRRFREATSGVPMEGLK